MSKISFCFSFVLFWCLSLNSQVFSGEKNEDQTQALHRTQFVLSLENEIDKVK